MRIVGGAVRYGPAAMAETAHQRRRRRIELWGGVALLGGAVATAIGTAFDPASPLVLAFGAMMVGAVLIRRGLTPPYAPPLPPPAAPRPGEALVGPGPRLLAFEGDVSQASSARFRSLTGRCPMSLRVGDTFTSAVVDAVGFDVELSVSSIFHEGRSLDAVLPNLDCSVIVHGSGVEHLHTVGQTVVLTGGGTAPA